MLRDTAVHKRDVAIMKRLAFTLVEKFIETKQSTGYAEKVEELIKDIERLLDEETTESIREFLEGRTSKLSKEVIAKCKTPEFVEWLRNYRD